jgi:uncharacterized membrane protein
MAARQAAKDLMVPEAASPSSSALGHLQVSTQTTTITHSGPLPPAEELMEYERVIPGGAERLLVMAENQSAHRIAIEKQVIAEQQRQSALGQRYGFILGLVGLSLGALISCLGHDWVGVTIAGATLTSLVSVFVLGKAQQMKSLAEKNPAKTPARRRVV